MNKIAYLLGNENIDGVIKLFREYSQINGAEVCFKSFEEELKNLNNIYGLPEGKIELVTYDDNLIACVALKKINQKTCEMKRLYVKEKYRNLGIGKSLINNCIFYAKSQGYEIMRLETLPSIMDKAIQIYLSKGFIKKEITDNILIMELNLKEI